MMCVLLQDLDIIFSHLHGMEALSSLREPALRALCRTVRYETHEANDILYWYIFIFVFILKPKCHLRTLFIIIMILLN